MCSVSIECCIILRNSEGSMNSTGGSCRSPDRHTKHSPPSVSPHHQTSQETGQQPCVIHWTTVISVKYPFCCQYTEVKYCIQREVVVCVYDCHMCSE